MNSNQVRTPEQGAIAEPQEKRPYEPPRVESIRLSPDAAEALT
jgi:hypothetical protein